MNISFTAKLWKYAGKSAWYFISVPAEYYGDLQSMQTAKRGFGSIKVVAFVGETKWATSIFPDTHTKTYLLPIKKEVRSNNNLTEGSDLKVHLKLIEA